MGRNSANVTMHAEHSILVHEIEHSSHLCNYYDTPFFNFSDCLSHITLCVTTKQGRVAMATEFQELDVPTFLSLVKERN